MGLKHGFNILQFLSMLCIFQSKSEMLKNGICDVLSHTGFQLQLMGPLGVERKTSVDALDTEMCSNLCCDDLTCDVALFTNMKCILVDCPNGTAASCQPYLASKEDVDPAVKDRNTTLIYIRSRNSDQDLIPSSIFNAINVSTNLSHMIFEDNSANSYSTTGDQQLSSVLNTTASNISTKVVKPDSFIEPKTDPAVHVLPQNDNVSVTTSSGVFPSSVLFDFNSSRPITLSNDASSNSDSVQASTSPLVTASAMPPHTSTEATSTSSKAELTSTTSKPLPSTTLPVTTTTESVRKISVVVTGTKEIRLPQDSLVLHAIADGTPSLRGYNYEWKVIDHPVDDAGIEAKHDDNLTLSTLTAGNYQFKVIVTDTNAYGEAYVNITVLEPLRINQPPVAVISPRKQTITLPNDKTVLDGSGSTDDDGIATYHWEMQVKPLQASDSALEANGEPVLQLHNLIAGDYEFELTVTDTDGATDSIKATVTVKQRIDNKPIANAGSNILIHLPQNSVVLHGNKSADDYGIVSYRWSIAPDSEMQGVDMQGSLTDTLTLTNFEVGVYSFRLTVTDASDQEDTATVTVNVRPESNHPPHANAGEDVQLLIPVGGDDSLSVQLDGNGSTDDKGIKSQSWKLKSGPLQSVNIKPPNSLTTSVSGLSKPGDYVITLTVIDDEGDTSSDDVTIAVSEEKPPVADAGPDVTIHLPDDGVMLDGSKSSDNYGIKSYSWVRDPLSPSVGHIVNHTDKQSKLFVVGLTEGTFTFHLTVTNVRGKSSEDTTVIKVLPDHLLIYLVELHLRVSTSSFTESSKNIIAKQLPLVLSLHDDQKVVVRSVYHEHRTGDTVMLFYVTQPDGGYMPALDVVTSLNSKLQSDIQLLNVDVKLVDTYVCKNNCSGHGKCHSGSKLCECDAFWMENFVRVYMGDGWRNCDWSILYVVIVIFISIVLLTATCYFTLCLCLRKARKVKSKQKRRKKSYGIENGEYEKLPLKPNKNGFRPKNGFKKNAFRSSSLMRSMTSSSSSEENETLFEKRKLISGPPKRGRRKGKPGQMQPLVEYDGIPSHEEGAFDGLGLDKEVTLHGGGHSDEVV